LHKTLKYPLLINALTGGTQEARRINRTLAQLAQTYGLAMAVGSMTIALEKPELIDTFAVVREVNPDGIIIANCGANLKPKLACEAVKMIQADGLQLHFNVPQELAMTEGDRDFRGIIDNVKRIADTCPVPVIAKEVGFGFSRETVRKLFDAGITIFDNAGCGGTNFLAIEDQRKGNFNDELYDWGIPTAVSLAEIMSLRLPIHIVASGGIRNAVEIAKAVAMGAEVAGIIGLFHKVLNSQGPEELDRQVENLCYQLKSVFLMSGARNCGQLRTKPVIILNRTAEWLRARSIDTRIWSNR
jgi:isopentenyl-diphosphate delta-isomerase, type 2